MTDKKKIVNFIETLEYTNIELNDFVDIDKVKNKIDQVQIQLNTLNYIIANNQSELERKIRILFSENKNIFEILPLFVAIKDDIFFKYKNEIKTFKDFKDDVDLVIEFINKTRLNKLIIEGKIKNFIDYITGVEVGIDTNSRKNRFGQKNEKDIWEIIYNEFKDIDYIKIEKQLILDNIENDNLIKRNKKFDFVITNTKNNISLLIETSYYNSNGSKINETSESFKKISEAISKYNNYQFLWVADGKGLSSIKKYLEKNFPEDDFICNKSQLVKVIKTKLKI